MIRLASVLIALALVGVTAPGSAKNNKTPGGDPCGSGPGVGTGNPCNGNAGANGNANKERVVIDKNPAPFTIVRGEGRGAFIEQVGDFNRATIGQSRNTQYARIAQDGDRNVASADQSGNGAHYAAITQRGDDNAIALSQSGAGVQVAYLTQDGSNNRIDIAQNGGLTTSGVAALQTGDRNAMSLTQEGENNMARLTQNGSDNAMTAVQNGNNQLTWTQTGNGLSNLQITQPAGQAIMITQSR